MTAYVLITGSLFRAPEQRVSKAGKPYVRATLLVKDGEVGQFWNVIAFSGEVVDELMFLREGEKLSAQGRLQIGEYEKEDKKRVSLGVIADHVACAVPLIESHE